MTLGQVEVGSNIAQNHSSSTYEDISDKLSYELNLIIRCTVSEILAVIDHKGPNWTFLTLKMTFRVIPYLSYFRTRLVSQQLKKLHDAIHLGSTLLLNNTTE